MGSQPLGGPFGPHLLDRLAKSQRFGLSKHIGHEQIVMSTNRVERIAKRDEVARDQPRTLMDQLVKRMLAIGAWLAPVNRSGVVIDKVSSERDSLAIALHRQLLQIGRETL